MTDFLMPSLGADMDEGTLVEWLVSPGDAVVRGQIVAVVDTAKAAIEVEVFRDGVVDALLVEPGTTVAVGTPLARLVDGAAPSEPASATEPLATESPGATAGGPGGAVASPIVRHLAHQRGLDLTTITGTGPHGEVTRGDVEAASPASSLERASVPAPDAGPAPHEPSAAHQPPAPAPDRVRASPLARRRAAELAVDLATVSGSGPDGVISVADVERSAAAVPAPASPPDDSPPDDGPPAPKARKPDGKQAAMREAIGALMARGKREIPHYYLRTTIDLATSLAWLRDRNAAVGVEQRAVPAVLLLKAAALAVREVPEVNGFFVDGRFESSQRVHLGVAISLRGGGLVAPAIHDADQLDLAGLMTALKDLVARARSGRLRASQMSDPTITVTNLGDQGVEEVQGVIYPPQVALVGFGKVAERPWAVGGLLGVHPLVTATLAADHRVTDGHRGGQYLNAVEALLQAPERLDSSIAADGSPE